MVIYMRKFPSISMPHPFHRNYNIDSDVDVDAQVDA